MPRSTREAARTLLAKVQEQGGYFTAKQAKESGYDYPHLEYHVSTGSFERVEHGLYRLTSIVPGESDDLIRLSLWSRNRDDEPQAVMSHESALVLHDLTELLPQETHVTVPPRFRKQPPEGCVIHKSILRSGDVEEWTGFRVTTPLRTLRDVAAGAINEDQLEKAVADALTRGLVRRRKLVEAVSQDPRLNRLKRVLKDRI
ncbi:MAG: type IV toxin-antitoxin system AbiEi family antitoxin domain-containing protein [Isosphaeraceae bacterium]